MRRMRPGSLPFPYRGPLVSRDLELACVCRFSQAPGLLLFSHLCATIHQSTKSQLESQVVQGLGEGSWRLQGSLNLDQGCSDQYWQGRATVFFEILDSVLSLYHNPLSIDYQVRIDQQRGFWYDLESRVDDVDQLRERYKYADRV